MDFGRTLPPGGEFTDRSPPSTLVFDWEAVVFKANLPATAHGITTAVICSHAMQIPDSELRSGRHSSMFLGNWMAEDQLGP